MFARRCVLREARSKNQEGKGKRRKSRSTSETRKHSEENGKGATQGERKDPQVPVRQESETSGYATIFTSGTCDHWHPPECTHCKSKKVDANREIRVCSSIQAQPVKKSGNATLAIHLEELMESNCVLKDCQGDTPSARYLF